jgi:hypothetical protein
MPLQLPPEVASRLAKVAGLLGSDFDGERAAAAATATRILQEHGLTWSDLVHGGAAVAQKPMPAYCAAIHQEVARRILAGQRHLLSPWETEFIESLARWWGRTTIEQIARLRQLEADLKTRGQRR